MEKENQGSEEVLTKKHKLCHTILRRWNYCLPNWPEKFIDEKLSPSFIETGFKGLYAGYRGDSCGELKDLRIKTMTSPTLNSLLLLDSEELKELAIKGIEKQKEDLIAHKELNSVVVFESLCKELDRELKAVKKYNPKTIEKEFKKAVK